MENIFHDFEDENYIHGNRSIIIYCYVCYYLQRRTAVLIVVVAAAVFVSIAIFPEIVRGIGYTRIRGLHGIH
jgi:hypothetical protein